MPAVNNNHNNELRQDIQTALQAFESSSLHEASITLLSALGYHSDKTIEIPDADPSAFLNLLADYNPDVEINRDKALFDDWLKADILFQLTDEELSHEASLFKDDSVNAGLLQSYLFFAIELNQRDYARGKLTAIARQLNRVFPMPVMVFIKHRDLLSIAVINRRLNKRDTEKDVLGKVTIIRDISLTSPHRGHLDILGSFALPSLLVKTAINSFDTLHAAWEEIFNVELLNKRFYKELANWYFWALPEVSFPDDMKPAGLSKEQQADYDEKLRATGLIRLLTRLIFCWFLKEKGLIPESLFDQDTLGNILKSLDDDKPTYHQAILQNLFFATLNQRMNARGEKFRVFAKDEGFLKNRNTYGVDNLYRHEALFKDPEAALAEFEDIPFLNGGLFECLDRTDDNGKKIYVDGFSRNSKKRPNIPNRFFFGEGEVNIGAVTGETRRGMEKVRGLIHILSAYKFTIVENTPIDQEIALDPELLGKVFENLLASYNEETKTTARKQTGSFYTPRPIVEYMVDESLKAHLATVLEGEHGMVEDDARTGLDILFAYTEKEHPFNNDEVDTLIKAIDSCKILDPACGSGAFPMGTLHKLVYILTKLDPDNARWKQTQLDKLDSAPMREELEHTFESNNDDYGRKLYLIENCLYGVDIQPIAIQLSKLRFFISLICDQKTNKNKAQNHGVRPLPNLETKFVAANTLIGLGEDAQMELFKSPKVVKIEKELQKVRHDYFAVQRRQQKLALQSKDKELRNELANELMQASFADQETSQKLAKWNPYDPHIAADFFEPLWMFDRSLVDGFDVVIGNPPWGAKLSTQDKVKLKEAYEDIDSSTPNSFAYFIGSALQNVSKKGIVAFVLPDSILIKDFPKTRKLLKPFIKEISWYLNTGIPAQNQPFVYVEHDVCVLIITNGMGHESCQIKKYLYDFEEKVSFLDSYEISKDTFILEHHGNNYNLLIKSRENAIRIDLEKHARLGDLTQCHEGIHTGNSRDLLFHKQKLNEHCRPLFYGARAGDVIENYLSSRSGWYVDYRKSIIDESKGCYASLRDERIFSYPKIYITRTGNPIKAFYDEDTYASNNFFSLQFRDYHANTEQGLKALLPLLLSSLANFYIRTFAAPRLGNTYIETKIIHLNSVPVSEKLLDSGTIFLPLVDLVIQGIKSSRTAEVEFLENVIDACVLECYFFEHMRERGLLFLSDVMSLIKDFNPNAKESSQSLYLQQFCNTANSPDHPLRNRLLRLTADSPDLLAVIKEHGAV